MNPTIKQVSRSLILIIPLLLVLTGCATVKDNARGLAGLGLSGAKLAAPQYAKAIEQIEKALASSKGRVDVIRAAVEAGYIYERNWYHEGQVVPASSIRFEDVLRKSSGPGETAVALEQIDAESAEDAALRAQIEAIIRASGIANEE